MYKFKTSEQNNDKATEFETKSLLYLLTKIKGHSGISLFIIDCFNDVTGVAEDYSDSWDIQSKNVASLTPRTVGKALYIAKMKNVCLSCMISRMLLKQKLKWNKRSKIQILKHKAK